MHDAGRVSAALVRARRSDVICAMGRIEELPSKIGLMTNVTALYLNDNLLPTIPPEIGFLQGLLTFSLHNNKIHYLPKEVGMCVKLQVRRVDFALWRSLPKQFWRVKP
jgi:Leucine-rich repeat (LRR) protein